MRIMDMRQCKCIHAQKKNLIPRYPYVRINFKLTFIAFRCNKKTEEIGDLSERGEDVIRERKNCGCTQKR